MTDVFKTQPELLPEARDIEQLLQFEVRFWAVLIRMIEVMDVSLLIPETFVSNLDGLDSPCLLYTNLTTGFVRVKKKISQEGLADSLALFAELNGNGQPLTVSKTESRGRDKWCVLTTAQQAIEAWNSLNALNQPHVLQRFIPSCGKAPCVLHVRLTSHGIHKHLIKQNPPLIPAHSGKTETLITTIRGGTNLPNTRTRHKPIDPYKAVGPSAVKQHITKSEACDSIAFGLQGILNKCWVTFPKCEVQSLEFQAIKTADGMYYLINVVSFGILLANTTSIPKASYIRDVKSQKQLRPKPKRRLNISRETHRRELQLNRSALVEAQRIKNIPKVPRIVNWGKVKTKQQEILRKVESFPRLPNL